MKLHYDPDTDSLYIELTETPSADSDEVSEGVVMDLDSRGNVVGFDIEHASKKLNLAELIVDKLPVASQKITT